MGRNQKQYTLNAPLVTKPTTLQKDAGRELVHISNQKETKLRTRKQQKTRKETKNPQIATLPHQKQQVLYSTIRSQKKLNSPRLQIYPLTRITNFVISDLPLTTYKEYQKYTVGIPTVVLQQQMEIARIETQNINNDTNTPFPKWEHDQTTDFTTKVRPLSLIEDYDPYYIDPDYDQDPYWHDELYDQHQLQFHHNLLGHNNNHETDEPIEDNKLTNALIHLWEPNNYTLAGHSQLQERSTLHTNEETPLLDDTHRTSPCRLILVSNTNAECSIFLWISESSQ